MGARITFFNDLDLQVSNVFNGSNAAAAASGSSFDLRSHGFAMGYFPAPLPRLGLPPDSR
jgi:hypothetical protein